MKQKNISLVNYFDFLDFKFDVLRFRIFLFEIIVSWLQHTVFYIFFRLIGEIQFMLDFMLDAKKMSHKYYAFVRNEDFYHNLSNMIYDNDKNTKLAINEKIESIIVTKNFQQLSKKVLFGEIERLTKENIIDLNSIKQLCQKIGWKKGSKLIESIKI